MSRDLICVEQTNYKSDERNLSKMIKKLSLDLFSILLLTSLRKDQQKTKQRKLEKELTSLRQAPQKILQTIFESGQIFFYLFKEYFSSIILHKLLNVVHFQRFDICKSGF